jgi:hypothetical protein
MILIGLAGVARSGKDTAAAVLATELGLYRHAFADPIKRMLEQVFGNNFVIGDRERIDPISGVSYRKLMQTLGTEWGRAIQPDLWTRVAKAKWEWITQAKHPSDWLAGQASGEPMNFSGMVISDVRFDNEAEWIRSEGGIIVHVERDDTEQVGVAGHASEAGLTKIHGDLVVENNSTLAAYSEAIDYLVALIKNPSRSRPAAGIAHEYRI